MTAPEVSGWPDKATVERAAEAMSVAETKWFHAPPPSADPGDTSDYFPTLARAALTVLPDPTADTVLLDQVRQIVFRWERVVAPDGSPADLALRRLVALFRHHAEAQP